MRFSIAERNNGIPGPVDEAPLESPDEAARSSFASIIDFFAGGDGYRGKPSGKCGAPSYRAGIRTIPSSSLNPNLPALANRCSEIGWACKDPRKRENTIHLRIIRLPKTNNQLAIILAYSRTGRKPRCGNIAASSSRRGSTASGRECFRSDPLANGRKARRFELVEFTLDNGFFESFLSKSCEPQGKTDFKPCQS